MIVIKQYGSTVEVGIRSVLAPTTKNSVTFKNCPQHLMPQKTTINSQSNTKYTLKAR